MYRLASNGSDWFSRKSFLILALVHSSTKEFRSKPVILQFPKQSVRRLHELIKSINLIILSLTAASTWSVSVQVKRN